VAVKQTQVFLQYVFSLPKDTLALYTATPANPGDGDDEGRDTMISDKDAIAQAQALYREACERFKKRPVETSGEIAFVSGARVAVLFDANGKLAAAYRVTGDRVVNLDGHELAKLRAKLMHRKVR